MSDIADLSTHRAERLQRKLKDLEFERLVADFQDELAKVVLAGLLPTFLEAINFYRADHVGAEALMRCLLDSGGEPLLECMLDSNQAAATTLRTIANHLDIGRARMVASVQRIYTAKAL
jgi:hypothetical protein